MDLNPFQHFESQCRQQLNMLSHYELVLVKKRNNDIELSHQWNTKIVI